MPNEIKRELVLQDQVSVDFTSKEQLWTAVLQVDHAFDSLKAINAYCPSEQINSSAMPNKFHAKNRFIDKPSNKTSNYDKSGNTTQYPHLQCVANQAQQRTSTWVPTKTYHLNINKNNAAPSKNKSTEQKTYSRS